LETTVVAFNLVNLTPTFTTDGDNWVDFTLRRNFWYQRNAVTISFILMWIALVETIAVWGNCGSIGCIQVFTLIE
jgi:hypothetical protein